ncbi:MAG: hypothetical protein Q8K58_14500 [Acidimicrobiales bacterium]|nr:hypothetical protein [Acidimicrobiales bacterium]
MPSSADSLPSRKSQRSAVARFLTNSETGKFAVVQWPNLPLITLLAATGVRVLSHPEGTAGTAVAVVGGAAILVWSALEIVQGVSPFRRVFGAVVLAVTVAGIVSR